MKRVIAYVDGFNLYYGLREMRWKRYYWLNIPDMVRRLLKPGQILACTKYFTSIVNQPPDKHRRQGDFLEALGTLSDLHIYLGHYLSDTITCRNCGHTYQTHHEKMTDVNITVELMTDAYRDQFDVALLVSADSDLVGAVKAVRLLFPDKRIVVVFPPARFSNALKATASAYVSIRRNLLAKCQFPDQVVKADGTVLWRPAEWR